MLKVQDNARPNSAIVNDKSNKYFDELNKERFNLIKEANDRVSLLNTLQTYNIFPEKGHGAWSQNLTCPFLFHKNGNESSPSFGYNFEDDRFNCFGCLHSGRTVEFISIKEDLDKIKIANKIIENYPELKEKLTLKKNDSEEINKKLFSFSNYLNAIIQKNKNNNQTINQIEKILWWFNSYLLASKSNIFVEDLDARISKALELLAKYE